MAPQLTAETQLRADESAAPWMEMVEMKVDIAAEPYSDPCCCPILVLLQTQVRSADE